MTKPNHSKGRTGFTSTLNPSSSGTTYVLCGTKGAVFPPSPVVSFIFVLPAIVVGTLQLSFFHRTCHEIVIAPPAVLEHSRSPKYMKVRKVCKSTDVVSTFSTPRLYSEHFMFIFSIKISLFLYKYLEYICTSIHCTKIVQLEHRLYYSRY